MPIYRNRGIVQEVLVHKECGCPVEKGFGTFPAIWYSCPKCDCWIMAVVWKKQEVT